MKKHVYLLLVALAACSAPPKVTTDASVLMDVDRDFSKSSVANGMKASFLEYADTAVVKLQENNFPAWGFGELEASLSGLNDSLFSLSWTPVKAELAESGDLGYTIGKWTLTTKDGTTQYGVYVTVWKRRDDGSWKYVVDAGNDTPGEFRP